MIEQFKSNGNQIVSTDVFSISFDGENEIEASLLGLSISNLAFVINEIVAEDATEPQCKLKVSAFRKGSFEILFALAVISIGQISSLYSTGDALSVIGVLKGIFDVKKLLKGEKPKAVEDDVKEGYVRVISKDGTDISAPLGVKILFSNPVVEMKITQISQAIDTHNPEGGFSLSTGNEIIHYNHSDIEDMSQTIPITEYGPTDTVQVSELTLPILKIALQGDAAWSFRFGTRAIKANIEDRDFLKIVHIGQVSFKAGDKLSVELIITTRFSDEGIPIRESYSILKVYGHIPASNQINGEQTKF